jgi:hypothetical protein
MNHAEQTAHCERINKACNLYCLVLASESKYRERLIRQTRAHIQGLVRRARVAHARVETLEQDRGLAHLGVLVTYEDK